MSKIKEYYDLSNWEEVPTEDLWEDGWRFFNGTFNIFNNNNTQVSSDIIFRTRRSCMSNLRLNNIF